MRHLLLEETFKLNINIIKLTDMKNTWNDYNKGNIKFISRRMHTKTK